MKVMIIIGYLRNYYFKIQLWDENYYKRKFLLKNKHKKIIIFQTEMNIVFMNLELGTY